MKAVDARRTVLVVDDEEDIRIVIGAQLTAGGFRVQTAANGIDALDSVRREPPDLILLDLMLPGINGFGICGIVKRDRRTSGIPIVMLTGRTQPGDRETLARLGADAYMPKTIPAEDLIARIKSLLKTDSGGTARPSWHGELSLAPAR